MVLDALATGPMGRGEEQECGLSLRARCRNSDGWARGDGREGCVQIWYVRERPLFPYRKAPSDEGSRAGILKYVMDTRGHAVYDGTASIWHATMHVAGVAWAAADKSADAVCTHNPRQGPHGGEGTNGVLDAARGLTISQRGVGEVEGR